MSAMRGAGVGNQVTGGSDPPVVRRPRGKNSPPVVVVGNKCDRELQRMVTPGELQDLVETMPQCVGLEASAKKNFNAEDIFLHPAVSGRTPALPTPGNFTISDDGGF